MTAYAASKLNLALMARSQMCKFIKPCAIMPSPHTIKDARIELSADNKPDGSSAL